MPAADLVLTNANIITMDPARPSARLAAVKGNKIALVGGEDELEQVRGAKTRVIDCGGCTVIPGFNDAHCHIYSLLRKLSDLDLSPTCVKSIADIKVQVRQRAAGVAPGRWISGSGYNEFYLAEKRHPDRHDLDAVAPYHPVVLAHRSLHACVLNSAALSLAGISGETPEPPGALIERDPETGEPTGLLFEMLGYIRGRVMPGLSPGELAEGMAQVSRHYLSLGITSVQDASISNNLAHWRALQKLINTGILRSRVTMMCGGDALSEFIAAGLKTGAGDDRLRLGAVKIILTETGGRMRPTPRELNELALAAHEAGFQMAIHCFEPATVEAAITALEQVNNISPVAGRRHRLEHCAECPPPLLARLVRLGAIVVTQPAFLYYSGERYLATIPPDSLRWLYCLRSLQESGLVVAGGSDAPVAPDNPLVGIYAAVTRRASSGQVLRPEEAIGVEPALALYTTAAAYAERADGNKGRISTGMLADMVVLSEDPLKAEVERLGGIRVLKTIIDGRLEWED
jgi:predicted amidohydrolase YtcJ